MYFKYEHYVNIPNSLIELVAYSSPFDYRDQEECMHVQYTGFLNFK